MSPDPLFLGGVWGRDWCSGGSLPLIDQGTQGQLVVRQKLLFMRFLSHQLETSTMDFSQGCADWAGIIQTIISYIGHGAQCKHNMSTTAAAARPRAQRDLLDDIWVWLHVQMTARWDKHYCHQSCNSASPATVNNLLNLVTSSTASSSLQSADPSLIDHLRAPQKSVLSCFRKNQPESHLKKRLSAPWTPNSIIIKILSTIGSPLIPSIVQWYSWKVLECVSNLTCCKTHVQFVHLTQLYTSEGRDPPSDVTLVCSVRSYLLSINYDHPQSFSVSKPALVTLICPQWRQARSDCHTQLQDGE